MKINTPLVEGKLIRRYKRFLADVVLTEGNIVTAHTPNTGSMMQCAVPGYRVLLSKSDNPQRKLPFTLERVEVNGYWVDIHTHRANRVVEEGLRKGLIRGFEDFCLRAEYPYGDSRIDFLLERGKEKILLEVKNVTLMSGKVAACFPDAVTLRGHKHIRALQKALREGYRGILFFLVQRREALAFRPADHIDAEYGNLLRKAVQEGVEVLAYKTAVSEDETIIAANLPVLLDRG
ncbi:MAG: DNA/RNA nuclease SfsA [Desulfuromonadaceae bacterium]|nr:DNA/RNA nuclease SfsA [Desulfuromonadaceae bacterium]